MKEITQHLLGWLDRREDSAYRGYFVSGHKHNDVEALVHTYTAPVLARGLRDREATLAQCALHICGPPNGTSSTTYDPNPADLDKLRELLSPFHHLAANAARQYGSGSPPGSPEASSSAASKEPLVLDEAKYVLPDFRQGGLFHPDVLKRLKKRLHRLPREISSRSKKRASVIVPLCHVDNEPSILFTQRSHNVNRHKGEVCFPGGMVDPTDSSVVEAGLRELHEEVGIHPDTVEVLGVLRCDWSEIASITGVAVTPVIGYLGAFEKLQLKPNPGEVRAHFTVPVRVLLDQNNWEIREYSPPVFREPLAPTERVIWGLTSYILHRFMKILPSVVFVSQIARTDFERELSF